MQIYSLTCRDCAYFKYRPEDIERLLPGLKSLSSAYSSIRGEAGICIVKSIFLFPQKACDEFYRFEQIKKAKCVF